jgi:hypothetical protein
MLSQQAVENPSDAVPAGTPCCGPLGRAYDEPREQFMRIWRRRGGKTTITRVRTPTRASELGLEW